MEFPAGRKLDKMVRLHMRRTDMKFGVGHVLCPVRQSVKSTALQAVGPGSTPGQGTMSARQLDIKILANR